MISSQTISLFFSVLLGGLIAGLLYGYECSVVSGLGNLPDREYLSAFQSINRAILNPRFFVSFMGTLVVLPVTAWLCYSSVPTISFYLLIGSAAVYTIGVFGVTMFANVPLNESLDAFDISSATEAVIAQKRMLFEKPWNYFHSIRTVSSIVSVCLVIVSILIDKKTSL